MRLITILIVSILLGSCAPDEKRILVFSKTAGFRHQSIEVGKKVIMELGRANQIAVDTTEDADFFTYESLMKYDAVVFLNTTGDILNDEQQEAFQSYIQSGKGYVGIHAAADTEYEWPWYGKLSGGYFLSHPKQQTATIKVVNRDHLSTAHLPEEWSRWDEWYDYKDLNPDTKVLAYLDESTYEGGKNGDTHPIIWYHEFDGGRAFYTGLGHTNESFEEPLFRQHLLGGIVYAIG